MAFQGEDVITNDIASHPLVLPSKMNQAPATKKEVESDSPLNGRCHCGAISYEFPCPPTEKVEPFSISSESRVVPPSMQKYPERGTRPHTNKWRATHCHCGGCRKTVGALMMDWVDMKANNLKITRNGPSGQYRITDFAMREFVSRFDEDLGLALTSSVPNLRNITVSILRKGRSPPFL